MRDFLTPVPSDHTIIFLHIPKTAGTSLHRIIKRQYRPAHLYHVGSSADSLPAFQQLPINQRARIRFLMGHFEMGVDAYVPRPSTYFTVLRDPVSRIVSYYAHVRRDPDHYCHEVVNGRQLDLEAFVRSGVDVMVDNGQTRMIAGVLYSVPFGQCGPEELETARRNLVQRFAFVGLTEQFDQSLLLMQPVFRWRSVYYARRNVTPDSDGKQALTAAAREAILEANQLDIALYSFAAERLAAQMAREGEKFAWRYHTFQQRNRRLSPVVHLVDELLIRLFRS